MSSKLNLTVIHSLLVVLFLVPAMAFTQSGKPSAISDELTTAVAKDVWQPFMESYRELDFNKLRSIHASELTRVSIDRNTIENTTDYFNGLNSFIQNVKKMNRQMDIKFSIVSTASGEDKVYQTGYYCFSMRGNDSEAFQPMGYGYFNVVLIQEDGAWKITLDADKTAKINEEEFRKTGVVYELD